MENESKFTAVIDHLTGGRVNNSSWRHVVEADGSQEFKYKMTGGNGHGPLKSPGEFVWNDDGDGGYIEGAYDVEGQCIESCCISVELTSRQDVLNLISVLNVMDHAFASDFDWSRKLMARRKREAKKAAKKHKDWLGAKLMQPEVSDFITKNYPKKGIIGELVDAINLGAGAVDQMPRQTIPSHAPEGPFTFVHYDPKKETVKVVLGRELQSRYELGDSAD